MKHVFKAILVTIPLFYTIPAGAARAVAPYYSIRSQAVDAAREIAGWQHHINLCNMQETYGSFSITPEYTRSFDMNSITQRLFGDDLVSVSVPMDCNADSCGPKQVFDCSGCPSHIVISGSQVADRAATDWLADYMGLPRNFKSVLRFAPRIQNFNIDLNFYIGMSEIVDGLFFRVHSPLTWTNWLLNVHETILERGTDVAIGDDLSTASGRYPAGYFTDVEIPTSGLLNSAECYFTGNAATLVGSGSTVIKALTMQSLKFAQFAIPCTCTDNNNTIVRLADIEMDLGYNFICTDDAHFGLAIRASAPTGNKPRAVYLFEPIAGSAGHWKIGIALTTHCLFWADETHDRSVGFWFDANVQHIFSARQIRTFDLVGKPMSRYALAQRLGVINSLAAEPPFHVTDPNAQVEWQNEFAPVANLTTHTVDVKAAAECDMVAKFAYTRKGFQVDIGYNFWATSCECIIQVTSCPGALNNDTTWALKGDAYVVGFVGAGGDAGDTVLLAATESKATIHGGTNGPTDYINSQIDDPQLAFTTDSGDVQRTVVNVEGTQVNSSITPNYITNATIDYNDGRTRGLSNKVFAHISYTWFDHDVWIPFIGGGGFAEFASTGSCPVTSSLSTCCAQSNCISTAISQWGVWIKGGISFQ